MLIDMDSSPVVLANTGNNYTGNTIIGTNGPGYYSLGTQAWLKLGASGVIPNGAGKGNVYINQAFDGLLDLAGFTQTINGLSGDGTVDNSSGNGSLSVGNNNQSSAFSGVIQNTTGTLALTKVGTGTFTLAGPNTYTGNTLVGTGVLALGNGGSIGASAVTVATTATLANSTTNTATIGGPATFNSGALAGFTAVGGVPSVIGKMSVTGNLALKVLVTQTGGLILGPDNDVAAQIDRCVADANAFYRLSFDAVKATHADEFHDLKVVVNKPGATVRTNTGYYGEP